jgi:hypothetical protein
VKNRIILVIVALLSIGPLASCSHHDNANKRDARASEQSLERQQKSQPTPIYDWSQKRQNLIELSDAQAHTTQTTTFFFLEGIGLVGSCPSIGFPIASTTQLTNPEAKVNKHDITLPQVEPTGVYTGDSSATYTICVDSAGKPYASYWEGYVMAVTGPAKFDGKQIVLTGKPTGEFSKGKS